MMSGRCLVVNVDCLSRFERHGDEGLVGASRGQFRHFLAHRPTPEKMARRTATWPRVMSTIGIFLGLHA